MFRPKGIIPAMVTPFDQNEELNLGALRQLVNYLIAGGIHGLFPVGSQGEYYALSFEEKKKVLETVVDETAGRVPVYAGTGTNTTAEVIKLNRMVEAMGGIAAVSIITPCFITPTQDELYEHYRAIAAATKVPILLYNNPPRTGVRLSDDLVARLSKIDNIIGVKDSSGDLTVTGEYIRRTDKDFTVLAGRDTLIFASLMMGGAGAIAACGNAAPRVVADIYDFFAAGDLDRARQAQAKLAPLRLAFELGSFPVVIKEALTLIGIPAGPARAPIGPMADAKRQQLKKVLDEMGLLR